MVPLRPASLEPLRAKAFAFFGLSSTKTISCSNDSKQTSFFTSRKDAHSPAQTGCGQSSQGVKLESSVLEEDIAERSGGVR